MQINRRNAVISTGAVLLIGLILALVLNPLGVRDRLWGLIAQPPPPPPAATAAPTSAPTTAPTPGAATFSEPVESYGLDRDHNRVIVRSSVPTAARLIDIERDVVVAEDKNFAQRHSLDWTVPAFEGLEKTFVMKVEMSTSGKYGTGEPVSVVGVNVKVLQDSRAAGGIQKPEHFLAFLKEPGSAVDRDGYVEIIKAIAPSYPGVSGLTSSNIAQFVESNLGKFKVETITSPLTGQFAYVRSDGIVGYSPVTIPAGTPVLTFDGKILASALCVNEVKQPVPTPTTTPTPGPTVIPGRAAIVIEKFNDVNGNKVRDANEAKLPNWQFQLRLNGSTTVLQSVATNQNGLAVFDGNLQPGTYQVCELQKDHWFATTQVGGATCQTATVGAGQLVQLSFGNRFIPPERERETPAPGVAATPTPAPTTPTPAPVSQFQPTVEVTKAEGSATSVTIVASRSGINVLNGVSPREPFQLCRFSIDDGGSGASTFSNNCSSASVVTTPGTHTVYLYMRDANGAVGVGSATFTFQSAGGSTDGTGQNPVPTSTPPAPTPTPTPAPTPQVSPSTNPNAGFTPPPGY